MGSVTIGNQAYGIYNMVTANHKHVLVHRFEPDAATLRYQMASTACLLPNSGLSRHYNFAQVIGDQIYLGTTGGEICIFNIDGRIYKATMPIATNGLLSIAIAKDTLFIGAGDGKLKRLTIAEDGRWNLTHEA